MAQTDEIILDVKINAERVGKELSAAINNVARLKQVQKELTKAIEEGNDVNGQFARQLASVKGEIDANNRVIKASTALLQAETLARIDDNASLDEQRMALNAAQKAYAQLSGEEKKTADASGGLRDQIAKLSDRVKEQEAAIGDNRRNVGNYAGAIMDASSKMGGFGRATSGMISGIKGVTTGFKAMAATPVIAILNVLITLIVKLSDRFKGNSAAMEQLTSVFGIFSGVGNIVNKIIDKIAEGIGWVAQKALELADKLGLITNEMKAGQKIAKEELAIQKQVRETQEKNADDQLKISKLKAQASEKDKYTAKERLTFIEQSLKLEEDIANRSYQLAKRQYELKKLQNEQSKSSEGDLKAESDLYVAMQNQATALYNKQKELNAQRVEAKNAIAAEEAAVTKAAGASQSAVEKAAQARIAALEKEATEAQKLIAQMRAQNDEMLYGLSDEEETEEPPSLDKMALAWGLDAEGLEYFKSLYSDGVDFAQAKQTALADQWQRNATQITGIIGGIGNGFLALGDLVGNFADESEDAAKAQKAFALTGILTNQAASIAEGALALSKGISSASALPFPLNIPAIATIVATITSMIAGVASSISQAKQLFAQADAQKFATGGIVGGTSYTGDKVPAMLNSREMVLNMSQQKELFAALNGGGGAMGIDYSLLATAIASQPAPIVVYSELQSYGDKVANYNEIASI